MNNKIELLIKKLKTKTNNNEKRNTKNIELHKHILNEKEEDYDEMLKLKLNNSKEIIYEIDKIIKTKEKNQEQTTHLIFLKSLSEKITNLVPKIQIQIERKCALISSDICGYESSKGEIFYNNNDSNKIIHLSCGHYIHDECLQSSLRVSNSNIEKLTPKTIIKCPSCGEDVVTLL
ncbi:hypothetical protein LY90DRAFT_511582 [Neocallimastix californiae]|uniref:RING-type domain-containing protein n=1 Tax=Neocallimastix californiae TaxID=1754190 RepID=A0A1Y2BNT7_9FUNG|nr:hypothetical protein LY90DRAFT_511582 [Neocallimastix californiae]|eukprot:ORY36237.1 hypothetical protein LY90DRAFT_511582 [Neocallimastix californiae]